MATNSPVTAGHIIMRPSEPDDIAAIAEIERTAFSDPWSRDAFRSLLGVPAVRFAVATEGPRVVGFLVMWLAADEAEIANLAVAGEARRKGIGKALLAHAISAARASSAAVMFLEVRESNVAAIELYSSHGFVAVGRRKRYYRRPEEDALVLRLDISTSA